MTTGIRRAILPLLCAYVVALSGILSAWASPAHLIHALNSPLFELCASGDGAAPGRKAPDAPDHCCLAGCALAAASTPPGAPAITAPPVVFRPGPVPGFARTIGPRPFAHVPGNPRAPPPRLG